MPATVPAWDLSEVPGDWLQAYVDWLDEDDRGDDKFARQMNAIYQMRDIAKASGASWHPGFEQAKAELIRRGLRDPDPEPVTVGRAAAVAAVREKDGCDIHRARFFIDLLTPVTEDGGRWIYGRKWYLKTDLADLLRDELIPVEGAT